MSEELRELRISKKLQAKDIVATVQRIYPSFDKAMLSKSENFERYGVTIRRDALDVLIDEFAPEDAERIRKRRRGGHRLTCRISCRLDSSSYSELQQALRADGFDTIQDWLSQTVTKYLESQNRKEESQND